MRRRNAIVYFACFILVAGTLHLASSQADWKSPHKWSYDTPMCRGPPLETSLEEDIFPSQRLNLCEPGPAGTSLLYSCAQRGGISYKWLSEGCQGPKVTRTWLVSVCANFTASFPSKTRSVAHQCSNVPNQRAVPYPPFMTLDTTHPIGNSEICSGAKCDGVPTRAIGCLPSSKRFTFGSNATLETCLFNPASQYNMLISCARKGYIKTSYWYGGGCNGEPFESIESPTGVCIPSFSDQTTYMLSCGN